MGSDRAVNRASDKEPASFQNPIILFDGVCNLCNGAVQFIIRRDPKSIFRFAALQSETGKRELEKMSRETIADSIILIDDGFFQKSTAALNIARRLSGAWPALYVFKILPLFFRDWMYDRIAKNRYRLFGKKDICMIPTPELQSRFLS